MWNHISECVYETWYLLQQSRNGIIFTFLSVVKTGGLLLRKEDRLSSYKMLGMHTVANLTSPFNPIVLFPEGSV